MTRDRGKMDRPGLTARPAREETSHVVEISEFPLTSCLGRLFCHVMSRGLQSAVSDYSTCSGTIKKMFT